MTDYQWPERSEAKPHQTNPFPDHQSAEWPERSEATTAKETAEWPERSEATTAKETVNP